MNTISLARTTLVLLGALAFAGGSCAKDEPAMGGDGGNADDAGATRDDASSAIADSGRMRDGDGGLSTDPDGGPRSDEDGGPASTDLGMALDAGASIVVPPVGGFRAHEPLGTRAIIDIEFGATPIPTRGFATSGDAARGVILGKITAAGAPPGSAYDLGGGNYAFRSVKATGTVAGTSGNGVFTAKEDLPGNTSGNTVHSYEEWYECLAMRMYGEGGTSDFEYLSDTGGGKFGGYVGDATPGNVVSNQLILWMTRGAPVGGYPGGVTPPAGPGDYATRFFLELRQQGTVSQVGHARAPAAPGVNLNSHQNMSSPQFLAGLAWQNVEYYFRTNTIGMDDGIFRVWVNGVLVTEYLDIRYRDAASPRGFMGVNWAQVYGGLGGRKTRNDYTELDHLYVSVGAMVD